MTTKTPIYLDYNATTPMDPLVLEAMLPFYKERFGNAASFHHGYGHDAKQAVEYARSVIAQELNAKIREIVFTSGATEAINLAIKGHCARSPKGKNHIITQVTEHPAVLDTCNAMKKKGWKISILPVDQDGFVDPVDVKNEIKNETALVAVMHANNEIGVIQDIAMIGNICKEHNVLFLVDAAQTFGKVSIDVEKLNIDLLAASAHKVYGPKGIGCLYVNQKIPKVELEALLDGGGHERGFRSGTLPVPLIVGFGKAVETAGNIRNEESERLTQLRDKMINALTVQNEFAFLNGSHENRLTNNVNVCFKGVDAETLIMKMKGIACSTGSACSSASLEPSHVIKALGHSTELAHSAVRFSLGRFTTEQEIDAVIDEIIHTLEEIKKRSPRHRLVNS